MNLKLALSIALRGNGMHKRAPRGTHRANQLGLRPSCIRRKFNRCSHTRPSQLSRSKSEYRAGTLAAYVRATAHIRGSGRHWRNLSAVQVRSPPNALAGHCSVFFSRTGQTQNCFLQAASDAKAISSSSSNSRTIFLSGAVFWQDVPFDSIALDYSLAGSTFGGFSGGMLSNSGVLLGGSGKSANVTTFSPSFAASLPRSSSSVYTVSTPSTFAIATI